MKLHFIKTDPTQNMTILVTDPVLRSNHADVAARLMDYGSVNAEQVGYLEAPVNPACHVRLQMMGGEFCGNASMSAGAYLAMRDGLPDGGCAVYPIEVSGADGIIECHIRRRGDSFVGTVDMPVPEAIEEIGPDGVRYPVVRFPGIAHMIVPAGATRRADAEARIADRCGIIGADALGVLLTDAGTKDIAEAEAVRIDPLVYVRSTGSAVWEHGCGSGSAAIGAYIAARRGADADVSIAQPGGRIRVQAEYRGGAVRRIRITGTVRIVAEGCAYID